MKRTDQEERLCGEVYYDLARALKSGYLRFPEAAPSVLKNKGILEKAGNYMCSSPPVPKLSLLFSTLIRNEPSLDNYRMTYREKYFIWTFDDEDQVKLLDRMLRTIPEGMCRHTRKEMYAKKHDQDAKTRLEQEYHTTGICTRTECQMLTTEELLMVYLNAPETQSDKNKRYTLIREKFKDVMTTYTLMDPDDDRFNKGSLMIRGIRTMTFRYKGDSNGVKSNMFPICFHADSKLEAIKNNMRPLFLNAKRASTKREFVLLQFAHDDIDSLREWQKMISECLIPINHNDILVSTFKDAEKIADRGGLDDDAKKVQGTKEINFSIGDRRIFNLRLSGNEHADPGMDFETVTGFVYTNIAANELFKHIIPLCNEYKMQYQSRFDRYIMGTLGEEEGFNNYTNLQVFIDPPMKVNAHSKHYGYNQQSFLVRAVKEDDILYDNWVSKKLDGVLQQPAHEMSWFVRKAFDVLSKLTIGETGDHINIDTQNFTEGKLFTRGFNLKKSFYSKNNVDEKMDSFSVVYGSVQPEGSFEEDKELELSKADFTADLCQLLVKVENIPPEKNQLPTLLNVNEFQYEQMLRREPGKAKLFLQKVIEGNLLNNGTVPNLEFGFGKTLGEMSAVEERVFDYLSTNTKEQARMRCFSYINYLLTENVAMNKARIAPTRLRAIHLDLVNLAYNVLKDSERLPVIKLGFAVFENLMAFGAFHEVEDDFKAVSDRHNLASFYFLQAVNYIISCNYTDFFGFNVMKLAFRSIQRLIHNPKTCLSKTTIDSVERLYDAVLRMEPEFTYEETRNRVGKKNLVYLRKEYEDLKVLCTDLKQRLVFYGDSVMLMKKRKTILKDLDFLYKLDPKTGKCQLNTPDVLRVLTNPGVTRELKMLAIPHVLVGERKTLHWRSAMFDEEHQLFRMSVFNTETNQEEPRFVEYQTVRDSPTYVPKHLESVLMVDPLYYQTLVNTGTREKLVAEARIWKDNEIKAFYQTSEYIEKEYSGDFGFGAVIDKMELFQSQLRSGDQTKLKYVENLKENLLHLEGNFGRTLFAESMETLRTIRTQVSILLKSFEILDDEKTRVSFSVTANAKELFGESLVQKYPDLGLKWCESIVKDLEYGIHNVKQDRMYAQPKKLMDELKSVQKCVLNDGLRFFFRPTAIEIMQDNNDGRKVDDEISVRVANGDSIGTESLKRKVDQNMRYDQIVKMMNEKKNGGGKSHSKLYGFAKEAMSAESAPVFQSKLGM